MEDILLGLLDAIEEGVQELSQVDQYIGQLETEEDTYPVTFPCCLVNLSAIEWKTLAQGYQRGTVKVDIYVAIDCYDDMHKNSGTREKVRERLQLLAKVHDVVRELAPEGAEEPFERIATSFYSLKGGIAVYQTAYTAVISGDDGED